ncbi:nuclear hormone receptor E75-like protein, partial [Sarcoptes scabiei]
TCPLNPLPSNTTCPLNPLPSNTVTDGTGSITSNRLMEDFSERFSPAIHGVVEFAKRIPGFSMLAQEDQVTLLKAGVFEVLLVRLACMFDSQSNLMICLNGLILRRDSLQSASNARFLLDSMFEFAERLNSLNLSDQEIALFCAVVVIAPDRPGLRNVDLVQKINKRLEEVLQKVIASNHPEDSTSSIKLFTELTKKIPDLRTLNALHSEKLLGKNFNSVDSTAADSASQMENSLHSNDSIISTTKMTKHSSHMLPDSQIESPDRWSSSSSSSFPNESSSIVYNQNSINQHSRLHCFVKSPRMDSPTDSGMDSGKEHCNASTPATSVCSSPQSAIEDSNNRSSFNNKESLVSAEKHETIDDMPVLKRALQAPPLVNTNKLMDEAYRYHKKFRAARRDTEPHSPTTTTRSSSNNDQSIQSNCNSVGVIHSAPVATITSMTSSSSSSSSSQSPSASILASAHSTLLKTLEQPSRYMNEQQLKRTDLIHNIIMNTEAVNAPATAAPMMIADNLNLSSQYYQDNHRHSYNSSEHCPYSGSGAPRAEKFAQISIMLSPDESHHHSYSTHIHSSGTNTFSNGRFATESSLPNSNCLSDHHHHQAITPTSGQQFLVIGKPTTLPAHSPRPSSTFSSTYSNHQPPYSHLHRCLTATVAPALATNGPIILQAASNTTNSSSSSKIHSTEFDCQPLNLSKKASPLSTIVSTISSSPLSSSTQ